MTAMYLAGAAGTASDAWRAHTVTHAAADDGQTTACCHRWVSDLPAWDRVGGDVRDVNCTAMRGRR